MERNLCIIHFRKPERLLCSSCNRIILTVRCKPCVCTALLFFNFSDCDEIRRIIFLYSYSQAVKINCCLSNQAVTGICHSERSMAKPYEVEESVLICGEYGSFDSPSTSLRVAQDDTLFGCVSNRVNNNFLNQYSIGGCLCNLPAFWRMAI